MVSPVRPALSPPPPGLRIVDVDAPVTHDLRARVLRGGDTRIEARVWAGDELPATWHLGAVDDATGRVVGVCTWIPRDDGTVQLRGMAVEPAWQQGRGIGRALVHAGLARIAPGTLVWANARDRALGFYERLGFTVLPEGFTTAETGLAHHRIEWVVDG
jgi:ribosomal protein S18 acetylase RimI-like enzyme